MTTRPDAAPDEPATPPPTGAVPAPVDTEAQPPAVTIAELGAHAG